MKQNILVTGGAGFIGSHVVDTYIKEGFNVFIFDNLSNGSKKNINPKAHFIELDIQDRTAVAKAMADIQPSIINHHAAHLLVGNSVKNPQFDAQVNILGFLNILEEARKYSLKKVLMASTGGAIYGDKPLPFTESMKEDPLSPYGISKRSAELYLQYYYYQYAIPYTILRYSNVYGPRQSSHGESGVIAIFSDLLSEGKQPIINGTGTQTRDFVFVDDVVNANMLATKIDAIGAFNIGTNTEISVNDLYDILQKSFKTNLPKVYGLPRPGEQERSNLSYELANRVLTWEPSVDLVSGLKKTTSWYKKKLKNEK